MKGKTILLTIFLFVILLSCISLVSALDTNFTLESAKYINRTENSFVNITIGAENMNIIQIEFRFGQDWVNNTNGTSASNSVFTNSTYNGDLPILIFSNTSAEGIINNGTVESFWFQLNPMGAGEEEITVNATGIDITTNATTINLTVNFAFSGYVKNESGSYQNATNVTIYQFIEGDGPPTEMAVCSVLSNVNGSFSLESINASADMYTLKMIYYNESNVATKTGTILPPFPANMYYPQVGFDFEGFEGDEFMKPPTLNGTTFYIEGAATINITAYNSSKTTFQKFGYEIMEQKTGFPIKSNIMGSVSSAQIIVPLNRDYTIMVLRDPSQFDFDDLFCDGLFMNDTLCPTPPKSNSSISPTIAGQVIDVQFNLTVTNYYLHGCIAVSGNSTPINTTFSIIPRMLPWEGFVPPMKDTGEMNLSDTNQLNHSDSRCGGTGQFAFYNINLINANYLIEFYARNASLAGDSEYVGAFQNITMNVNTGYNITLRPFSGEYKTGGDVNTTKITIRFVKSNGTLMTSDTPHAELVLKNESTFGELNFIVESISNGQFSMPIPQACSAKLKFFPNQAPPSEKSLNLSNATNDITIITMTEGDMGFRKVNASGELEQMNVTEIPIQMRFLRSSTTCNVIDPNCTLCVITSMTQNDFNPLKALVAGKINMEMKLTSSNVTMTFYNFDMFSAKQPPMHAIMNDQASSGSGTISQVWDFGNFVPAEVYDYVVIEIPYSGIDDSKTITAKMPIIKDENWDTLWNSGAGDTTSSLTSDIDEYLNKAGNRSFNSTGYRDFLSTTGVTCSKTNPDIADSSPTAYCYVDTTKNVIYIRIPHFSGGSFSVSSPSAAGAGDGAGGAGGGVGFNITQYKDSMWDKLEKGETAVMNVDSKTIGIEKIKFKVNKAIEAVGLKVLQLTENPVEKLLSNAYKYFEIRPENLNNEDISSITIEFSVSKDWLLTYDIETTNLWKYNDNLNEWVSIGAEKSAEDNSYAYFESKPNAFSYFAITAEPVVAEKLAPKEKFEEEIKKVAWWVWLIIAVIVIAAIILIVIFVILPKRKGIKKHKYKRKYR